MSGSQVAELNEAIRGLLAEKNRLREGVSKAADWCIDIQNCLHGIPHNGGARREARDLERMLRKLLEDA